MVGAGVSPRLVQERLGHANVSVTLGLYSHVMPGHDQAAVDAFGAALRAFAGLTFRSHGVATADFTAPKRAIYPALCECAPWDSNPEPAD